MASLSALLLVLLAADPAPVTITADDLEYDGKLGLTNADGHARLATEGLVLTADRLVYDEAAGTVMAVGRVVARVAQGELLLVVADVVNLRLSEGQVKELFLLDGQATTRAGITAERLLAAESAAAVEASSSISALIKGNHLMRSGHAWTFEDVTMVPCECNFKRPSWSVEAPWATVDPDAKRVSIVAPLVRVYQVPVLWLPWLSLPMSNRQTGLLAPRPSVKGQNGFGLEQPLFITLGRSADLTLTPGYFGGTDMPLGIRGPRLGTEFNYALSARTRGTVLLGLLYDLREQRDPTIPNVKWSSTPRLASDVRWLHLQDLQRGLRGDFAWLHLQDFDGGWGSRVDLRGHSDGYYYQDLTTDVVASQARYLRSTALAFQRGQEHLVTVDVTLRQDVSSGYDWLGRTPLRKAATPEFGPATPEFGPGTLQRLPAVTATLPLRRLAGPLFLDLAAEAVRLAPLFSSTGDEGDAAGAGKGDRRWQAGEREARDRLTLAPRLHLAGSLAGVVGLSASALWRQSLWAGEASRAAWHRGALVLDARAESEVGRRFGGWRHTLTPLVALRAIPLIVRGHTAGAEDEPVAYDEVDAATPAGGSAWAQGVVELRQRLTRAGSSDGLQLDLGQNVELVGPRGPSLSETWARLKGRLGWVSLSASANVAPGFTLVTESAVTVVPTKLSRLAGAVELSDGRGHGARAEYVDMVKQGVARTRAPLDLLFGDRLSPSADDTVRFVSGAAFWNFGPLGLMYQVTLSDMVWPNTERSALSLTQHSLLVAITPACDCWRVEFSGTQRLQRHPTDLKAPLELTTPEFSLNFTVSRFGSIGTK